LNLPAIIWDFAVDDLRQLEARVWLLANCFQENFMDPQVYQFLLAKLVEIPNHFVLPAFLQALQAKARDVNMEEVRNVATAIFFQSEDPVVQYEALCLLDVALQRCQHLGLDQEGVGVLLTKVLTLITAVSEPSIGYALDNFASKFSDDFRPFGADLVVNCLEMWIRLVSQQGEDPSEEDQETVSELLVMVKTMIEADEGALLNVLSERLAEFCCAVLTEWKNSYGVPSVADYVLTPFFAKSAILNESVMRVGQTVCEFLMDPENMYGLPFLSGVLACFIGLLKGSGRADVLPMIIAVTEAILADEDQMPDILGRALFLRGIVIQNFGVEMLELAMIGVQLMTKTEDGPLKVGCIFLLASALWVSEGGFVGMLNESVLNDWKMCVAAGIFANWREWGMCLLGMNILMQKGVDFEEELVVHAMDEFGHAMKFSLRQERLEQMGEEEEMFEEEDDEGGDDIEEFGIVPATPMPADEILKSMYSPREK
jgi:hypothetical protein